MKPLSFTVPGLPQPKERPRFSMGRVYTPSRTQEYEKDVFAWCYVARRDWEASAHGPWPLDAKYGVRLEIHFADRRRSDMDNVEKAILDALNCKFAPRPKGAKKTEPRTLIAKGAWHDDSQVWEASKKKHIDPKNPRVEVTITVLEE